MWKVAGGSMSSTIATVDTFSKGIDGARTRMVGYGQDIPAARRRGGVPGGGARRLRRPRAPRPPVAGDAGGVPDRRAVSHVARAGADSGVGDHGPDERLADSDRGLVL